MNFNKYLLNEQDNKYEVKKRILDFFADHPSPADSDIHAFSEREGINAHKFEEIVYEILGSVVGNGRSKDFKGKYDPKELKMGIKIETEHTGCELIATKIAKDHLAEIPDYYTRLGVMEKDAGIED